MGEEKEKRENILWVALLFVHFPNAHHRYGWTKPEAGIRNPYGSPSWVAGIQSLESSSAASQNALAGSWVEIRVAKT